MRSLYDQEYLDSGCTLDYDEIYTVDDTLWSYLTNFFILALCVLVVVKFPLLSAHNRQNPYMIAFFVFTGIAFGLAGILHATVHTTDHPAKPILERVLLGASCIANGCLALVALTLLTPNVMAWRTLALLSVVVTIFSIAVASHTVNGLFQMVVLTFATIAYGVQSVGGNDSKTCLNATKAVSTILLLLGLLIQAIFRGTCGDGGYEDCFESCFLPNPAVFNHNALFHLVYMVGLIILAIAEDRLPSLSKPQPLEDEIIKQESGIDGVNSDKEDSETPEA